MVSQVIIDRHLYHINATTQEGLKWWLYTKEKLAVPGSDSSPFDEKLFAAMGQWYVLIESRPLLITPQWCRNRRGATAPPSQYLADQLTLFKLGEVRSSQPITTGTSKFFHLPASLCITSCTEATDFWFQLLQIISWYELWIKRNDT